MYGLFSPPCGGYSMYDVQAYLFLSEAFFSFLFFSYSIDEQIGRGSRQNRLEASSFFSLDEMF
jgi:hypothetical protein